MPKPPPKLPVFARSTGERRSGEGPWASVALLLRSFRRRLSALEARPAAKEGPPGRDGAPGRDGKDGVDGRNGVDGVAGAPGKDGAPGRDGADGRDGRDGLAGRSIRAASIDDDGRLVLAFTDGSSEIAGVVCGAAGKDGAPGRDGVDGRDGAPGRDGQPGKDGAPGPRGERGLPGAAGVSPSVEILWDDDAPIDADQLGRVRVTRLRLGDHELSMLTLADE